MQLAPGAGLIATSARTAPPVPLHRPTDLGSAIAAGSAQEGACFVAGGTDLCAQYNEGLAPAALVALDRIAALREVFMDGDTLVIGSGVTHAIGCEHPLVQAKLPGFADAWRRIANVRVRFWATIGGNLMARRTRYEMSLLLSALAARLHVLDGAGTSHTLAPADLWAGRMPAGGLLHQIRIPLPGRVQFAYDRTLRPAMTLAVCRDATGARAAVGTEWCEPHVLPVAATSDDAAAVASEAFAALPASFADPVSSHWYLRRAGTVMLRRNLETMQAHG